MFKLPDEEFILNTAVNFRGKDPIIVFLPVNRYLGFRSANDPIEIFTNISNRWDISVRFVDPQSLTILINSSNIPVIYSHDEQVKGSVFFSYAHDPLDRITMRYVIYALELSGHKVINGYKALHLADDKGFAALLLANQGIPIPNSLLGTAKSSSDLILKKLYYEQRSDKVVFSKATGHASGGVGVTAIPATSFYLRPVLWNIRNDLKPKLIQEDAYNYGIETERNVIRIYVVGGKVVGSYFTSALGYVNTIDLRKENIELGQYFPSEDEERISIEAATILGCKGYCRLDVSKQDKFTILEVNPVADIDAIKYGLNIHEHLLWHALEYSLAN